MKIHEMRVRIKFTQPILGSMPADEELYTKFIASKAPADWLVDEEVENIPQVDYDKGVTVFPQDEKGIFLYNYHIKGFLKNAGNVLKEQLKIKNLRNKLDDYLFIKERKIYLIRNGKIIKEEDGVLERPLRAMTMQGERVALASSEVINPPAEAEFTIQLLEHKEITLDTIRELLDYGKFQGIGQWRNAGFGQFIYEELT
ncbi:TPA: hypothetical protein ACNABL_004767 [Escherichia coli]